MNYWPKHIGPWLKATVTLNMTEEGAYSRLCDWCYAQEQPLPLDLDEVFKIARANSKPERDTTVAMVQRFFVQTDNGYMHSRVERELVNARNRGSRAAIERSANAQRQKNYRDRRRRLFQQAYELGVPPVEGMRATNEQLVALIVKAGGEPRYIDSNVTRDVTSNALLPAVSVTALETTNALSEYIEEGRDVTVTRDITSRVTAAGAVCKAMRATGMARVNPSDARLLELLQLGVDVDAIVMAASEAVARHKGFEWALARAKGQHEDHERDRAEMLKWAPGLAGKA